MRNQSRSEQQWDAQIKSNPGTLPTAPPKSCATRQRKARETKLLQQKIDAGKPAAALKPNAVKFIAFKAELGGLSASC
jgi:hypothetical protein